MSLEMVNAIINGLKNVNHPIRFEFYIPDVFPTYTIYNNAGSKVLAEIVANHKDGYYNARMGFSGNLAIHIAICEDSTMYVRELGQFNFKLCDPNCFDELYDTLVDFLITANQ